MAAVLVIDDLPSGALEAAAEFHARWLPEVRALLTEASLVVALPPAPYDHTDWRRAAARDLARMAAPVRVNLIGGGGAETRAATLAYLGDAPGVTGQYLPLHGS
jgi:hypothetical protein